MKTIIINCCLGLYLILGQNKGGVVGVSVYTTGDMHHIPHWIRHCLHVFYIFEFVQTFRGLAGV